MNDDHSIHNTETTIDKLRNLLNKYSGRPLDDDLSRKIEGVCLDLTTDFTRSDAEVSKTSEGSELRDVLNNIKERRRLERRNKDKIIDIIGIGLCLLDKELRITWANKTLCNWLNIKDSPVGSKCHDIYHCNEIGTASCPATNAFNGLASHIIETWVESMDRKKMCVEHVAIPIYDGHENINSVLILTIDSTEREKTVHKLLLLQRLGEVMQGTLHLDKLLHLIMTCVTSGYAFGFNRALLFLINKEHNVLYGKLAVGPSSPEEANQIWQEISSKYSSLKDILEGLDYSHNIDTPLNTMIKLMVYPLSDTREVVVSCATERIPIIIKNASTDPRVTNEFRQALRVNEFACVPLIAKNEPIGVIVADNIYIGEPISEDRVNTLTMFANQAALAIENAEACRRLEDKIDQLTETQQRLIRSEKLAAIGSMLSYVAHEIRNPLSTIGGFAKTLSRFRFTDPDIKTKIDIIVEEVKRLEQILNNITDFGRSSTLEKVETQICEILESTCVFMESYFQENHIELHKRYETDIPEISVDPGQLKQVFLNVLMNAAESMPDGGKIEVKIKYEDGLIKIDVIDNGKGIPEGTLQNIFDPFFTTKPKGTGVGLTVSLKIIEEHGGSIDVTSVHGEGTTLSITLPVR